MRKTYILLLLWMLATLSVSGQTIRFLGGTVGNDNLYMINSDGSGYAATNPFSSSTVLEDGLFEASDKLIYGVSKQGGASNKGFVFRIYADGRNLEIIKDFSGADAQFPNNSLIEGTDGKLYGTTLSGSNTVVAEGTIFRLDKDGSNFEALRYLDVPADGQLLEGGIIEASDGFIYGTTQNGGNHSRGTIFRMAKDGTNFSVVYHFNTAAGCCTSTRLIEDNGKLIGLNGIGGGFGNGAVYSYDLSNGSYTGLGGVPNTIGFGVNKNFIIDNGFLYGVTISGAANGTGSIFKMELATGTYTLLHDNSSTAGLVTICLGSDGNLYGTTQFDGANGNGSLFKLTTTGIYSSFYSTLSNNGNPRSGLIEINNLPPTLIAAADDVTLNEGDASYTLNLATIFAPSDEPAINVSPSISGNTNAALFTSSNIVNGILTMTFESNVSGTSDLSIRATDSKGDFTETTFTLTIDPVADDPSVTNANTTYKTLNTSGLVVSKNAVDGVEVSHFKVTNISDGTLFLNDGTSQVNDGEFVAFNQGMLGLKFLPAIAGTPTFDIQASTSADDSGLGGSVVTATISASKAPLVATAENKSRAYGAANPDFTFTFTGFLGSDDTSTIDTSPIGNSAAVTADVGTYAISASGGIDNNYDFSYVDGNLTVSKADLAVSADNGAFRYGDVTFPSLSYTYAGFVNAEDNAVLDLEPSGLTTTATITSPRGVYPIKVNPDGDDNNYNFIYEDGEFTIGKAQLTVTAADLTKKYGDINPDLSFSYSGFVFGEDDSILDMEPEISTQADELSEVGTYDIVLSGGLDDNYEFVNFNGALTVEKAILEVVADDLIINEGESIPTFNYTYDGFVNEEDEKVLDTEPTASVTISDSSLPGVYPIALGGGIDNNYDFNYVNGELTISEVLSILNDISEISIWPNPTSDKISFDQVVSHVEILSVEGRILISAQKIESLNVSSLSVGTYLIRLSNKGNKKIVTTRMLKR